MKRAGITITLVLMTIILAVPTDAARPMRGGSGGWGAGSVYNKMYNPATVETIRGNVERIDAITPTKGMSTGVHLRVKTGKGPVSVHLGPEWYLKNQDVFILPDDWVEITGSRVEFEGKPVIIAKEVVKADQVLELRDDNGYPVWSGWRRR